MVPNSWSRRDLFKAASVGVVLAAFSIHRARNAAAQQVKWSSGTEPPKLRAPANPAIATITSMAPSLSLASD
jgi:hypothetical protein